MVYVVHFITMFTLADMSLAIAKFLGGFHAAEPLLLTWFTLSVSVRIADPDDVHHVGQNDRHYRRHDAHKDCQYCHDVSRMTILGFHWWSRCA